MVVGVLGVADYLAECLLKTFEPVRKSCEVIDCMIEELYPCSDFDVSISGDEIFVALTFQDVAVDMRVVNVLLYIMKMFGCDARATEERLESGTDVVITFHLSNKEDKDE